MPASTRSKSPIWLLGSEDTEITGTKLPSKKQVLCMLLYHHKALKETIRGSAVAVIKEVLLFWNKARTPVRPEHHAVKQLEALHDKWQTLKKNAKRSFETQQAKIQAIVNQLGDLFDIAYQDALVLVKNPEDKEFLHVQHEKGRRGHMDSADMALNLKEKRKQRQNEECKRIKQAEQEQTLMDDTVVLTASDDSTEEEEIADGISAQYPFRAEPTKNKKKMSMNLLLPNPEKSSKKHLQP